LHKGGNMLLKKLLKKYYPDVFDEIERLKNKIEVQSSRYKESIKILEDENRRQVDKLKIMQDRSKSDDDRIKELTEELRKKNESDVVFESLNIIKSILFDDKKLDDPDIIKLMNQRALLQQQAASYGSSQAIQAQSNLLGALGSIFQGR